VFLMQSAATEAGVSIDPHAAELLTEQVGNDRLAIRSELDKLFTFVGDAGPVTVEHVAALIGDASTTTPDAILDAALFGDVESLDAGVQRLRVEGGSPASLASQMLRQLILLWTMGVTIESGASVRTAVDRARPPVFSRRRASVEAALRRWSANELIWARRVVGEAVAASRHTPLLEPALISSALHDIAARSQTLDRR
jgi:DNA polymerase III subunit delta